jgi:hypothetical protein
MPLDDSLVMMDLLDGIRRDGGLVFPRDIEAC